MNQEILKTILPLYLGQKVKDNTIALTKSFFLEIKEADKKGVNLVFTHAKGMSVRLGAKHFIEENYFLLLRPLSSMTEEEARGICGVMGCNLIHFYAVDDGIWICSEDSEGLTVEFKIINDEIVYIEGGVFMTLIPWLCAKGFDCFGLIRAGIAKDATTNNK